MRRSSAVGGRVRRSWGAALVALGLGLCAGHASADPPPDYVETAGAGGRGGQAVVFRDDVMDAAALDGSLPLLRVAHTALRGALVRPRLHFVPELLKSVENL